jgi:Flp pilus assembly protein TadB
MEIFIGGALLGLGLAVLVAPLLPSRPKLAAAMERMGSAESRIDTGPADFQSRIGSWIVRHLPALPFLAAPARDLVLVGISSARFYYQKAVWAVGFIVFVLCLGIYSQLLTGIPIIIPAAAAVPAAAIGWFIPDYLLKNQAANARQEFARAVAVYLELVAAERRRDAPPAVALENAAQIGDSWVFRRINQELTRSRYDHVQPWEALLNLADEIGVPELAEAAKIVRLSGDNGAAVYEALRSAGKGLRLRMLNNEHTKANKASEQMAIMITVLALVFTGIVLTPLIMNLM